MKHTLELYRAPSDNGYIFGEIYYNCTKICDTLELESDFYLSEGKYQIFSTHDFIVPENIAIGIINSEIPISKFCGTNTEIFKKIKIRKGNNYISLGNKANSAELTNCDLTYLEFMQRLLYQLKAGFPIYLNIKNMDSF